MWFVIGWPTLCLPCAEWVVICLIDWRCVCPVQIGVWQCVFACAKLGVICHWLTDVVFALCRSECDLSVRERSCLGPQRVRTVLEGACVYTRIGKEKFGISFAFFVWFVWNRWTWPVQDRTLSVRRGTLSVLISTMIVVVNRIFYIRVSMDVKGSNPSNLLTVISADFSRLMHQLQMPVWQCG